jgi:hypothetical protein
MAATEWVEIVEPRTKVPYSKLIALFTLGKIDSFLLFCAKLPVQSFPD